MVTTQKILFTNGYRTKNTIYKDAHSLKKHYQVGTGK